MNRFIGLILSLIVLGLLFLARQQPWLSDQEYCEQNDRVWHEIGDHIVEDGDIYIVTEAGC